MDTPDDPSIQLFQRVWDEHGGEGGLTNYRVYGMAQPYTFVQALQAAGPEGSTFEGPRFAPFRFSADRHAGMSGMQVTRITGGTTESLTPVLVTDNGDAPITEYTGEPS